MKEILVRDLLGVANPKSNMAARRVFVPLAIRWAVGSPSFSVLQNRLFSTSAAVEHTTLVRSTLEKGRCCVNVSGVPRLPIPDGFPFTVTNNITALHFTRQDKDEKVQVKVDLKFHELINGDLCFPMYASVRRGHWALHFDIIAGPKTLLIQGATICRVPGHKFWYFEELLDSKGINKGLITSLLSLLENKDGRIDA